MTWALAGVGLAAAVLAIPTVWPIQIWMLLLPGFALSLVGDELAGVWLVVVVGASAGLAAAGGVAGEPGWVGLGLAVGAAAAFARQVVLARRAAGLVDENLAPLDGRHPAPRAGRWWSGSPRFTSATGASFGSRTCDTRPARAAVTSSTCTRSRGGTRDAPVLVQIHGGAWMTGNKRTQGRLLMNRLARAGWVCVAINYQLSPRVRYPEHLVDCKRALAWVRDHVGEFGGDPSRVAVTGGSAGGHLAALVALTANDPAFQPGFETVDTSVMACVSMYGAYMLGELFAVTGWGRRAGAWMGRVVAGVDVRTHRSVYDSASPLERDPRRRPAVPGLPRDGRQSGAGAPGPRVRAVPARGRGARHRRLRRAARARRTRSTCSARSGPPRRSTVPSGSSLGCCPTPDDDPGPGAATGPTTTARTAPS